MDTRMVGGEVVTDATTYSYMVAIQPKYLDTVGVTRRAPFCSGVLIQGTNLTGTTVTTDNYVLTSAHCALS
jgi:secreted trypsin-like serine protease